MKIKHCIFVLISSSFYGCATKHLNYNHKIHFKTAIEAKEYFYDRRLQLQRLYEMTSEPYFGKPKEKDCKNSVDTSGSIIDFKKGQYFKMKLLANDHLALGDCLPSNNTKIALYEFKICNENVYESRTYFNYNEDLMTYFLIDCPQKDE